MSMASGNPKFGFDHIIEITEPGSDRLEPGHWPECCIFRVPGHLRNANPEAYTPQLVSIGPMHYNNTKLKSMEKQKRIYFSYFRERLSETDPKLGKLKKYYDEVLIGQQQSIRHCYSEEFDYLRDRDEFANMMILDAVFIIELFLRIASRKLDNSKHKDDYMVTNAWLTKTLQRDLLLLENQLPISVLVELYKIGFPHGENKRHEHPIFLDLARPYFEAYDPQTNEPKNSLHEQQSQYFTEDKCELVERMPKIHFTDLIRNFYLPSKLGDSERAQSVLRTATKLRKSGVSFEKVLKRRLLDIRFEKNQHLNLFLCLGCIPLPPFKCFKARFRIPQLKIDYNTECVLRNLIAFEQCHYPRQPYYICNYVSLIDSLIQSQDDVELLVEKEVIVHELGSDMEVATLVNGLCKHVVSDFTCYKEIIDNLNDHYQSRWNRSMAALRLVYFRDPWRASSTAVGIAVLVFTIFNFIRVVRILF